MSIIHSFDPERTAVINPDEVHILRERKLDACIVNFSYKILDALLQDELLELVEEAAVKFVSCTCDLYIYKDTNIGVIQTQVGAPFTAGLIEDLAPAASSSSLPTPTGTRARATTISPQGTTSKSETTFWWVRYLTG